MTFIIICSILLLQYHVKFAADSAWRQSFWDRIWAVWAQRSSTLSLFANPIYKAAVFVIVCMLAIIFLHKYTLYLASFVLLWLTLDAFPAGARSDEALYRFRHLFAVWFWFVLLGINVAMLYFLLMFVSEKNVELKQHSILQLALNALEWIPARLLGLSLALVSSFMTVLGPWLKDLLNGLADVGPMLQNWAELAASADSSASLQRLLSRCALLWLVIVAILSMGAYIA